MLFSEPDELAAYISLFHDPKPGPSKRDSVIKGKAAARAKDSDLLVDGALYLRPFAMKGEQLAWTTDGHPTPLGHRRIAELMATLIND